MPATSKWIFGLLLAITGSHPNRIAEVQSALKSGTVQIFFDSETGLLTRVVRYTNTIVGTIPSQTDYADYRTVASVKVPFKTTITWTTGQATIELNELQANVQVDAAKFKQPPPAIVKPAVH